MQKDEELEYLAKSISSNLLESKYILDVLYEIADGDGKFETLFKILKKNIKISFDNIEKFRQIISLYE